MEDEGKKLGVPAKVVVGRLRDGPLVAPRNEAEFSTELEIRGYSRPCGAEPSFSSVIFGEKRIQAAGEAANRDGLKVMGRPELALGQYRPARTRALAYDSLLNAFMAPALRGSVVASVTS